MLNVPRVSLLIHHPFCCGRWSARESWCAFIAFCYTRSVHVISQKRIREAVTRFPRHEGALLGWYKLVKTGAFENFAVLRSTFPGVDKVGRFVVFNIAGNHLRIVSAMHFDRRRVYIREILTHSEYDEEKWKR